MRWWTSENESSHMCVGSTVGPTIENCVVYCQISREMKQQVFFWRDSKDMKLINCVGGGSSAMGSGTSGSIMTMWN